MKELMTVTVQAIVEISFYGVLLWLSGNTILRYLEMKAVTFGQSVAFVVFILTLRLIIAGYGGNKGNTKAG